jgi:uncharacterized membrane protein YhhN
MALRDRVAWIVFAAAIAAGVSYVPSWSWPLPPPAAATWKGLGVGLLALYAALRARTPDGWLFTAVMALGCGGDVLLEVGGRMAGGATFLAGHVAMILLCLRNRRPDLRPADGLFAAVLIPVVVALAWLLPSDRAGAAGGAVYAAGLSVMAATAWLSRFPRPLVGAGALLFVASDLLIFARTGPLAAYAAAATLGVWVLYFAAQVMIALGVTRTLARPTP